ncbi:Cell shape-determining protein MreB [Streptomyces sp. CA-256286]|nr:Cell shape-determining protein MreB [Streptomyces sp. CA-256286]
MRSLHDGQRHGRAVPQPGRPGGEVPGPPNLDSPNPDPRTTRGTGRSGEGPGPLRDGSGAVGLGTGREPGALRVRHGHRRLGGRTVAARGLALDLGSSRTRAWVPGHGLVTDPLLSSDSPLDGDAERPVRRGRIVDPEACGRLLGRIADAALGPDRTDSVIVLSHPVLAGAGHRNAARELLAGLGPTRVLVLSSARAAAAHAGPRDAGPLLVVDMGAELTEVTLLVGGRIADARQAETGLSDLDPETLPATLVRTVVDMVMSMWRQDRHGAIRGALRKGPVLAGGGALRPDVTDRIARCLGTPVRPADDPSTTVVRGAGQILSSVLRHGVTPAASLSGRPR